MKFAPKLTLRKLKKNTSYSPDVGEDDGVRIPKGKNRAANKQLIYFAKMLICYRALKIV